MPNFDPTRLNAHFELWNDMKEKIARYYTDRNKEAVTLMEVAIGNYETLLEKGGLESNKYSGKQQPALLPLNGEERLDFVKDKIRSHYAYIQLDALYTESKKKVARLSAMR